MFKRDLENREYCVVVRDNQPNPNIAFLLNWRVFVLISADLKLKKNLLTLFTRSWKHSKLKAQQFQFKTKT